MARTERLFDIIRILRAASKPVLAADIAETLEVSIRTIYRDVAHLQARQVPIYGETGIGYVMRAGYDLPPLAFDEDEAEAIIVGLSLVSRTGDKGLWKSAKSAARKLREVAPGVRHLIASSWGSEASNTNDILYIRRAIRAERKLQLSYCDADGSRTDRTVWPLAMIYYCDNEVLVSWCEMRAAVRHFRVDRMLSCTVLADQFPDCGAAILSDWEENQKGLVVQANQL
ncbi:helix-turn-helix transcriptional regulator [Marimonas arenosa]|uniref:YafY family transcriptional regulator n=1 Tax=Marimonas arenosa TaxID=1795305 RepID=A0AAE3WD29_9RHOB|nr:YafY family protein [Marimonas arenosa]MDQ2090731.1 YafY family transcriptional regulator [Marimonas arenosa]